MDTSTIKTININNNTIKNNTIKNNTIKHNTKKYSKGFFKLVYTFSIIIIIISIYLILRKVLYHKLTKVRCQGKSNTDDVNLLYDNYYESSDKKENKRITSSLGVIRKNYFSNKYDCDIDFLNIKKNVRDGVCRILIVGCLDISFELQLAQRFKNKKTKLEIISCCDNLIQSEIMSKNISKMGLDKEINILYMAPEDIYNNFNRSTIRFDRIVLRENIGYLTNRKRTLGNLKKLLSAKEGSFIYIKTFVFTPVFEKIDEKAYNQNKNKEELNKINSIIFDKQCKIIDYWNYNFSTLQCIVNDLKEIGFKNINYAQCPVLLLSLTYNIEDLVKLFRLYFIEMNMRLVDLNDWLAIYTIKMVNLKIN